MTDLRFLLIMLGLLSIFCSATSATCMLDESPRVKNAACEWGLLSFFLMMGTMAGCFFAF